MGLVISKGLTLKSYNTPAAIAGVAPTLDYRFALDRREIEAISLTDKLTYTGATNGTFVNRAGLIERATTDQPRFDHGPASRQSLGLLVEEQRVNNLVQSENFSATWTLNAVTVGVSITAPNGTTAAQKLEETATTEEHRATQISAGGATTAAVTLTVFAKAAERTKVRLAFSNLANWTGGGGAAVIFDLSAGTAVTASSTPTAFSITPFANGWYRCSITGTPTSSLTPTGNIFLYTTANTYAGTLGEGIYLWGAQLETGAFPTSYIPTTTTALTRTVDSAVIDGTGVITGTYTLVEKPAGCAVVNGTNIDLVSGFTAERVMLFPAALSAPQITAIRGAM
jgi:hypothetical protein